MNDDIILWLWLRIAVKNCHRINLLLEKFDNVEAIYNAKETDILEIEALSEKETAALIDKDTQEAQKVKRLCDSKGIDIITLNDERYPFELKQIYNNPPVLFAYGNCKEAFLKPKIAIVGTRDCTAYGEINTSVLSGALALSGFSIVTGVADGIDTAAIKGALKVGGSVIAVIPSGHTAALLSTSYKFKDIRKNGVILSEQLPDTPTMKYSYQDRNRLLSGLASGTVVTQAPIKSGALITANHAINQNRDLFVLAANIDMKQSAGSNRLLVQGATSTLGYKDIIDYYKPIFGDLIKDDIPTELLELCKKDTEYELDISEDFKRLAAKHLDEEEKLIFSILDIIETDIDFIIQHSGLPVSSVMSILTSLEAKGAIVSCPGNKYKIKV